MEFNKRVGPNNRVGRKMFENQISVQTLINMQVGTQHIFQKQVIKEAHTLNCLTVLEINGQFPPTFDISAQKNKTRKMRVTYSFSQKKNTKII